jgi:dihydroorotase/N-acyl-D-amino-acid deacylase
VPDDFIFENGRVADGTGAPLFAADVAISGGRVVAIGKLVGRAAKRRIDASGLVVAPGFIDLLGQSEYNVLVDKRAASKITQGITTEVTGEGDSIAPMDAKALEDGKDTWSKYGVYPDWTTLDGYFRSLERRGTAINLATFVGSGSVRAMVMGEEKRAATDAEIEKMKAIVDQGNARRSTRRFLRPAVRPEHLLVDG